MKAYTGIGSRQTPVDILLLMKNIAHELGRKGWTLWSGGADGADHHFELAAAAWLRTIFLPWPGFNAELRDQAFGFERRIYEFDRPQHTAYDIAEQFHPNWRRLTKGAQALHARNVHQILGPDVSRPQPSRFVLCWTPNGAGGGGTGQALRIARHYGVPVFDLALPAMRYRVATNLLGE